MSAYGASTAKIGECLGNFTTLYLSLILRLPNVSNIYYHGTGEVQLSEQHKRSTGECFLVERFVLSCSSYVLRQEIP